MANGVEEVVHVSISAQDAAPSAASFDKICFAAYHTVGSELIRDYTSLTSLQTDFAAVPSVLAAASAFFAPSPHPATFSVGRLTTARAKIFTLTPTVANLTAYTLHINGTAATYTSDASATAKEIVEGLKAAIDLLSVSGLTASEDDMVLTLTSTAGVWYSLNVERDSLFSAIVETTGASGLATELSAITAERDDFYGLAVEHQSEAVMNAVSAWAESQRKIYIVSSQNKDISSSSTTDAASDAKTSGYNRTAVGYNHAASEDFPEIRWMASRFPNDPGSETWNFKRLSGAEATTLTGTQVTNLTAKNAWAVRSLGGIVMTFGSKMASGRYIDVQIGLDWLQAFIETEIFTVLVNSPKVPYTDAGLGILEGIVRKCLQRAVAVGFLADDDNLTVTITPVTEQATSDRSARIVRGLQFRGRLAGAAEQIYVTGIVFP